MHSFCLPYLRQGYVVCNVEYRLAPVAPAPAAVNDALDAAAWFFKNAGRYNVDTRRIVVTGASAGGHLALMVGMTPVAAGLGPVSPVAAVVDCYGPTDVGRPAGGAAPPVLGDAVGAGRGGASGPRQKGFAAHLCAEGSAADPSSPRARTIPPYRWSKARG